jgi:glutamate dehydrogenase
MLGSNNRETGSKMSSKNIDQKQALLDQVVTHLTGRLGARQTKLAEVYLQYYFRRVPIDEIVHEAPSTLATIVSSQLEFLKFRAPGEILIRIYNPGRQEQGWESEHTIIEIVNDDMPFLVDTATLTLAELDLGVHLIIHPVMRVKRDDKGKLITVYQKKRKLGKAESVMQFQVDRRTRKKDLVEIEHHLKAAFADVRRAVSDWRVMERKASEARQRLAAWAPQVEKGLMNECREFMQWLMDDYFIFLGVRDYEISKHKGRYQLTIVPDSGLGILRETENTTSSRPLSSLADEARGRKQKNPLIITKANARSTVHRSGYLDYIGVLRFDENGRAIGERRFLGLFTSMAYNLNAMETPLVRMRAQAVLNDANLQEGSHAWKTMVHNLETLPRDELLQANSQELREIATGVLNLQERSRVRLFIRRERYGRFYSCLVYIPRERFNTENREAIQALLFRSLKGQRLDYGVSVSESRLARLQVIVRPRAGEKIDPDVPALEQKIVDIVRSWTDSLTSTLLEKFGEEIGLRYAARFSKSFPEAYKEDVSPWVAAFDVENAAAVVGGEDLRMSLYRPRKPVNGIIRFKLFRKHEPIPLSEVLPILENLGLHIVSERPYELHLPDGSSFWIQDFDMIPDVGRELDLEIIRSLFKGAFERALRGDTDSDGFNRLIIASQMNWRQVKMLRAYCKYLLQTGVPFSLNYMAETLARYPAIARLLVELFEASFDPARDKESDYRREMGAKRLGRCFGTLLGGDDTRDDVLLEFIDEMVEARQKTREAQVTSIKRAFKRSLESVTSLDEDRILLAFYRAIGATLRSNYFQKDESGQHKDYISFKLDSQAVPDLPLPRPYREIWVFSPRFEGIHLRGGKIARGGLRWSDRREDFRTEVLGLMKAQNVKNTMIVPVGAKGGFVVKRSPTHLGRDAVLQEGIKCYTSFINGLLDITDNLDDEKILPPREVVKHDSDDPYLVVAADKGTATFSDIANGVSEQHGFWLGDAFASGGSVGYDHKGMGITARGAWEGVKRHFREMGRDIQREPFTVVGIGDMSGDVFGNGMLLSKHTRLIAAFNHMHIFLDPEPDEKTGFRERRRLFRMQRSNWDDYNRDLISSGGGVFSRQDKTIPLSLEIREWLGIEDEQLTPHALIRELIKAPVDLLWNGGIGTYVKASTESHAEVGDLANNLLRVDGRDLKCKVIGEGGNLGFTQKGRMEFASGGGRVNTDFIDNSAGVDTSDHEVNIKILLNQVMRAGEIDANSRKDLMVDMTDEVATLVLSSNYLQTLAISMMEKLSGPRLGSKQHFISVLEREGLLNRQLEFLPEDEELTERRNKGEGMLRPELSVLLSYSKIRLYQQLLASDVPEDPYLSRELVGYFPRVLQDRYADYMQGHRLKREIIATQVTNGLVNRMGASFTLRMHEDTGAEPAEVAKAYTVARSVFEARDFWDKINGLDNKVDTDLQISALLSMWDLLRQTTRWLLNLPGREFNIQAMIDLLAPGLHILTRSIQKSLSSEDVASMKAQMQPYLDGGFSKALARRIVSLQFLFPALDVVETAARWNTDVRQVADVFFGLGEVLELRWLRSQVEALKVVGQWHARARANLRDELFAQQNLLVGRVLQASGNETDPVSGWISANEQSVKRLVDMMHDMKNHSGMDYATITVAVRSLARLASETA